VAIAAALHVPDFRAPHEGPCTDSHLPQSCSHVRHLTVDLPHSAAAAPRYLSGSPAADRLGVHAHAAISAPAKRPTRREPAASVGLEPSQEQGANPVMGRAIPEEKRR
jgi:hypothetical protein